jgi:hypothetical protein
MSRKVFAQNIKRKSQNPLGHPLTLKMHLHSEHFVQQVLYKRKNEGRKSKWDAQNLDIVQISIRK